MMPPRPRLLSRETREWLYAVAAALGAVAVIVIAGGHP
jgi:hypothetical protein